MRDVRVPFRSNSGDQPLQLCNALLAGRPFCSGLMPCMRLYTSTYCRIIVLVLSRSF
jgi:hypothetical protein